MKKFFLYIFYGTAIAFASEFICQGLWKRGYAASILTAIPFPVILAIVVGIRALVYKFAAGWRAPLVFYLIVGAIGLSVEWFLVGWSPWRMNAPIWPLEIAFQVTMFSFWETVTFGPHVLLDSHPDVAGIRRRFLITLIALGVMTYGVTFGAELASANKGARELLTFASIMVTFVSANVFYVQYFVASCRRPANEEFFAQAS